MRLPPTADAGMRLCFPSRCASHGVPLSMAPPRMRNDVGPLPILMGSLGILLLTIMDGLIKFISGDAPTAVLVLLRFSCGAAVTCLVYLVMGAPRPTFATLRAALLRGVAMIVSSVGFFAALGMLPLTEAIALSFTSPIMIALFGWLFLKEAISRSIFVAILLGSAGVGVMLAERLDGAPHGSLLGVLFVLGSTVSYAASQTILRARTAHDPLPTIVFLQNLVPALLIAPFAALNWQAPPAEHLWVYGTLGLLGTAGHFLLAFAFSRAKAARMGVVEYTAFVWAAVIGYVWFAETPSPATLIGASLIIAGALAVAGFRLPILRTQAGE